VIFFLVKICYLPARFACRGISLQLSNLNEKITNFVVKTWLKMIISSTEIMFTFASDLEEPGTKGSLRPSNWLSLIDPFA
jgi:hypothetical protein